MPCLQKRRLSHESLGRGVTFSHQSPEQNETRKSSRAARLISRLLCQDCARKRFFYVSIQIKNTKTRLFAGLQLFYLHSFSLQVFFQISSAISPLSKPSSKRLPWQQLSSSAEAKCSGGLWRQSDKCKCCLNNNGHRALQMLFRYKALKSHKNTRFTKSYKQLVKLASLWLVCNPLKPLKCTYVIQLLL